jgi:hypothetical protein
MGIVGDIRNLYEADSTGGSGVPRRSELANCTDDLRNRFIVVGHAALELV